MMNPKETHSKIYGQPENGMGILYRQNGKTYNVNYLEVDAEGVIIEPEYKVPEQKPPEAEPVPEPEKPAPKTIVIGTGKPEEKEKPAGLSWKDRLKKPKEEAEQPAELMLIDRIKITNAEDPGYLTVAELRGILKKKEIPIDYKLNRKNLIQKLKKAIHF